MKKLKTILAALAAVVATFAFAACDTPTESCEHEFTDVVAVAATCETAGLKAHKLCSKCGLVMVGDEEKTAADVIVPALGHDYEAAGEGAENYFDEAKHFVKNAVCKREGCGHAETFTAIQIGTADELMQFAADINALDLNKNLGCNSVKLTADIDLAGKVWQPIMLNHYDGTLTFDGDGHAISNLTTARNVEESVGFIGYIEFSQGVEFKNLTFKNATISADNDGDDGVAAFVGYADGFAEIKLTDCKVVNCTITGGNWAAAFYGSLSAENTGVDPKVEITNCSVEGTTIKGNGCSASAIGHATGSEVTSVRLTNCSFKNNTIECVESGRHNKAGYIVASIGVGDVTLNGCAYENVTAVSDGVAAERIYGRLSFYGSGSLTVDGAAITQEYDNDGNPVA